MDTLENPTSEKLKETNDTIEDLKQKIIDLDEQIQKQNTKIKQMDNCIEELSVKSNHLENKTIDNESEEAIENAEDEEIMINCSEKIFKCDQCGFVSSSKKGLKLHTGKLHKNMVQVDGNVSNEENNNVFKVVFVAEDKVSAEAELREFYIGEIISNYSEDIIFIEDESGELYNGLSSK